MDGTQFENSESLANDITERQIHNFEEFLEVVVPLSHLKVKRSCMNYEHHFLVTNICPTSCGTLVVTILQYTSSELILVENATGMGKVVMETHEVGQNKPNSLFDFESGLYILNSKTYPSTQGEIDKAFKRIGMRIGETEYHLSWNNCEHLIRFVMTGNSSSDQFRKNRCKTEFCNTLIANFKEIGFRTALLVSALGAIAGSLVRRAYVRVIIASIISYDAHIGNFVTDKCPNIIGRNIIEEAKRRLSEGLNLPNASKIIGIGEIIMDTKHKLNNTYVCAAAEYLAKQAVVKICISTVATSFGLETIILTCFIYFNLIPLRRIFLKNKEFCRILFLRIFAGYFSTILAVVLGTIGQLYYQRPAMAYFVVTFVSGLFFRYVLSLVAGFLFDCCPCSWNCSCACESNKTCKGLTVIVILIAFSSMCVILGFFLN